MIPLPDQSGPFKMVSNYVMSPQAQSKAFENHDIYNISYIEITLINSGVKTHILLVIHLHNLCEKKYSFIFYKDF